MPQEMHESEVQEPDQAETQVQVIIVCLTLTRVASCSCLGRAGHICTAAGNKTAPCQAACALLCALLLDAAASHRHCPL